MNKKGFIVVETIFFISWGFLLAHWLGDQVKKQDSLARDVVTNEVFDIGDPNVICEISSHKRSKDRILTCYKPGK